jgi:hypothetical protein
MTEEKLKFKVGLEIVVKATVANEEYRIIGSILGWEKGNFFVSKITDKTNIHLFTQNRPVLIGFVNEGKVYGFNTKIIMNIIIRGLSFFVLEYPENLEIFPLRKQDRLGVYFPGNFRYEGEKRGRSFEFQINDINSNGSAITTFKELSPGDCIIMNFSIPTQGEITDLKGVVVNIRNVGNDQYGYGIEFIEEDPQKKILEDFTVFIEKIKKLIRVESII